MNEQLEFLPKQKIIGLRVWYTSTNNTKLPDIYCEVVEGDNIHENELNFFVFNGAWFGTINLASKLVTTEIGTSFITKECEVIYDL